MSPVSQSPGCIGLASVSADGALLCARTIIAEAERTLALERRPRLVMDLPVTAMYLAAMSSGDWDAVVSMLVASMTRLHAAGATVGIIPANAVHAVIEPVIARSPIPVLDLVALTASRCAALGAARVGVLGAAWTMRSGLYDRPLRKLGLEAVAPDAADQQTIHEIITTELHKSVVNPDSTKKLLAIVAKLKAQSCDAIALACTELPMCLDDTNCGMPTIDTTRLLAEAALRHVGDTCPTPKNEKKEGDGTARRPA